jgi:hypothetical protein
MSTFKPGIYVKGEDERYADTPAKAVALEFNGFSRQAELPLVEVEENDEKGDEGEKSEESEDQGESTEDEPKPRAPRARK